MLSLIDLVAAKEDQKSQGKLKRRVSQTFHNLNLVKWSHVMIPGSTANHRRLNRPRSKIKSNSVSLQL
jgi:hypothetical protein